MRFVNPATLPKTNGYSHDVVVNRGKTIFISGQVALDGSGNLVGRGDFAAQTEQVFKKLEAALKSSGASFKDVAKLTFFVVDRAKILELRDVRDRYISQSNPPASSLVVVSGLVREEFLVKIVQRHAAAKPGGPWIMLAGGAIKPLVLAKTLVT